MAATTMVGTFKMAGELADGNMAVRLACTLIHEAEKRGELIERGDLIERVCHEYSMLPSVTAWLGSPSASDPSKSPVGALYDRVKGPKGSFVMKMLPLGMQFVGTAMDGDDFRMAKRQAFWKKEGVYEAIKVGGIYKNAVYAPGSIEPVIITGEIVPGFTALFPDGSNELVNIVHLHHIDCDVAGCNKLTSRDIINRCLKPTKKKSSLAPVQVG